MRKHESRRLNQLGKQATNGDLRVAREREYIIFEERRDWPQLLEEVGKELAVVAEPAQEAAQVFDVGRHGDASKRFRFLGARPHAGGRNRMPGNVSA